MTVHRPPWIDADAHCGRELFDLPGPESLASFVERAIHDFEEEARDGRPIGPAPLADLTGWTPGASELELRAMAGDR